LYKVYNCADTRNNVARFAVTAKLPQNIVNIAICTAGLTYFILLARAGLSDLTCPADVGKVVEGWWATCVTE
jgi:hypothetical protein